MFPFRRLVVTMHSAKSAGRDGMKGNGYGKEESRVGIRRCLSHHLAHRESGDAVRTRGNKGSDRGVDRIRGRVQRGRGLVLVHHGQPSAPARPCPSRANPVLGRSERRVRRLRIRHPSAGMPGVALVAGRGLSPLVRNLRLDSCSRTTRCFAAFAASTARNGPMRLVGSGGGSANADSPMPPEAPRRQTCLCSSSEPNNA